MKLATNSIPRDIKSQIKDRFAEFNRKSAPSKGRKYPAELRELVRQGAISGIKPKDLKRLSGMSSTAIERAQSVTLSVDDARPVPPRRLQVVDAVSEQRQQVAAPFLIRLPSGVTIEMAGEAALTQTLLHTLASLEVKHAASR